MCKKAKKNKFFFFFLFKSFEVDQRNLRHCCSMAAAESVNKQNLLFASIE
jgi:hypothetical protein